MFVLIITFYYENDANRRSELLRAIRCNINNSFINKIYILCESGEEFLNDLDAKIEIVKQNNRPKFHDLIKFANGFSQNIRELPMLPERLKKHATHRYLRHDTA